MLSFSYILSTNLSTIEQDIEKLKPAHVSNKRIKTLEYRNIDADARSRQNNLIFRVIKENHVVLVRYFLKEHLKMDNSFSVTVIMHTELLHQLQTVKLANTYLEDVEQILS